MVPGNPPIADVAKLPTSLADAFAAAEAASTLIAQRRIAAAYNPDQPADGAGMAHRGRSVNSGAIE
jgi:hypothetical protein